MVIKAALKKVRLFQETVDACNYRCSCIPFPSLLVCYVVLIKQVRAAHASTQQQSNAASKFQHKDFANARFPSSILHYVLFFFSCLLLILITPRFSSRYNLVSSARSPPICLFSNGSILAATNTLRSRFPIRAACISVRNYSRTHLPNGKSYCKLVLVQYLASCSLALS